jgi:hypothetical protein
MKLTSGVIGDKKGDRDKKGDILLFSRLRGFAWSAVRSIGGLMRIASQ